MAKRPIEANPRPTPTSHSVPALARPSFAVAILPPQSYELARAESQPNLNPIVIHPEWHGQTSERIRECLLCHRQANGTTLEAACEADPRGLSM